MKTKRVRSRNYCFTDFELLNIKAIYESYKDVIRYICWGLEKAPTTGKEHFQGWIQFFNPKSPLSTKKIFGTKKIAVFVCKGTEFDNDKYCKKDGQFFEFGRFVSQGQRTDLENLKKMVDDEEPAKKLWDSHFETMVRYHSGINKYKEVMLKEKTKKFRKVDVQIYYGETETGKTRRAYEESQFKISASELQWWDGYDGEESILIDEYNNDVNITKMLGILDGYQLRLPVKGGFTYANWKKVIITTNLTKEEIHCNAKEEHRKAFYRRISKWTKFSKMAQSEKR